MDINDIAGKAKDVLGNVPGGIGGNVADAMKKAATSQVSNVTKGAVGQVKAKANQFGLGGVVDKVVNAAETKVGMDLDGDGDTGK